VGVTIHVVAGDERGVDIRAGLAALRTSGVEVLHVEGGSGVITSLLRARCVDRVVVAVALLIIGEGTAAVADLGTKLIADAICLGNRTIVPIGDDVLLAWDVAVDGTTSPSDGEP